MRALVVCAHPDPASLTHAVAGRVAERLGDAARADLPQEGFDPRFTPADRRTYQGAAPPEEAVLAEQRRVDDADHLVLVFPVWWWSLPALLKGWIDRTFIAGWAFDEDPDGGIVPRLERLTAHWVPVSGTAREAYARHGYAQAFEAQVLHGVVDFCGMRRGATAFVHDSESPDAAVREREAAAAVEAVAAAAG